MTALEVTYKTDNERVVICTVGTTSASAVCHPNDRFDLAIGQQLAYGRAQQKRADLIADDGRRYIKRAYEKINAIERKRGSK